jgi:hypothetical protein
MPSSSGQLWEYAVEHLALARASGGLKLVMHSDRVVAQQAAKALMLPERSIAHLPSFSDTDGPGDVATASWIPLFCRPPFEVNRGLHAIVKRDPRRLRWMMH